MGLQGSADSKYDLRGKVSKLHELRGYSAYEIAVIHGFNGTEEEWATELRRQVNEAKGYSLQATEARDDLVKVKSATDIIAEQNLYFSDESLPGFNLASATMLTPIPEDGESVIVMFGDEKYTFAKKTYELDELNIYHYVGNLYLWFKGLPELDTGENVLVVFADDWSALIITTKEGEMHKFHAYEAEFKINEEYLENTGLAERVSELEKGEGMEEFLSGVNERVETIEKQIADMNYKAISITSFSHNVGTKERGETVTSVNLTWAINKTPKSLKLGSEVLDVALRSKTVSGLNITAGNADSVKWTLTATDERDAVATKTTPACTFLNCVYYGAAAQPTTIDSAFIKSLATKTSPTNSRARSITVNGGGKYIWYCLPTGLGKCTFTNNGFPAGIELVDTIEFTNALGHKENYYVYRSNQLITDTVTIGVS